MKNKPSLSSALLLIFLALQVSSCINSRNQEAIKENKYHIDPLPEDTPLAFPAIPHVDSLLVHRGIFSHDLSTFYYTVSDRNFHHFEVRMMQQKEMTWSEPKEAFFNSAYNEHGMSFSPDGRYLYFSSDRPTGEEGVAKTWQLWRCEQLNGHWTAPEFVRIPNLQDKLISHPSITSDGTLYFHASNLDYSEMKLYRSQSILGQYQDAVPVPIPGFEKVGLCTPYVSPKETYLIFAVIGEQLELMICYKNENGGWTQAQKLKKSINTLGQGNPSISPDGQYLMYTKGKTPKSGQASSWHIVWVGTENLW